MIKTFRGPTSVATRQNLVVKDNSYLTQEVGPRTGLVKVRLEVRKEDWTLISENNSFLKLY